MRRLAVREICVFVAVGALVLPHWLPPGLLPGLSPASYVLGLGGLVLWLTIRGGRLARPASPGE